MRVDLQFALTPGTSRDTAAGVNFRTRPLYVDEIEMFGNTCKGHCVSGRCEECGPLK